MNNQELEKKYQYASSKYAESLDALIYANSNLARSEARNETKKWLEEMLNLEDELNK